MLVTLIDTPTASKAVGSSFCYNKVSMTSRVLLILSALSASLVLVLHTIAMERTLYFTYRWFDIPMHFLGGLALGWFSTYFLARFFPERSRAFSLFLGATLCSVLLLALVWEGFELIYGIAVSAENYLTDTMGDILIGLAGGTLAAITARQPISNE